MNRDICLIDTSVFVRFLVDDDVRHLAVRAAIAGISGSATVLVFTPQVVREGWAVLTRPASVNGYGLSPSMAKTAIELASNEFMFKSDSPEVYLRWLDLVESYNVSGRQVHDAYHVAAMITHGIAKVLTLDKRDFNRHPGIQVVSPESI